MGRAGHSPDAPAVHPARARDGLADPCDRGDAEGNRISDIYETPELYHYAQAFRNVAESARVKRPVTILRRIG
jgi:hypothetical protein